MEKCDSTGLARTARKFQRVLCLTLLFLAACVCILFYVLPENSLHNVVIHNSLWNEHDEIREVPSSNKFEAPNDKFSPEPQVSSSQRDDTVSEDPSVFTFPSGKPQENSEHDHSDPPEDHRKPPHHKPPHHGTPPHERPPHHDKPPHEKPPHRKPHHHNGSLSDIERNMSNLVSRDRLRESIVHYFSAGPHLSAQNDELVKYTQDAFNASGFDTEVDTYNIWVNYPVSHRVALSNAQGDVETELTLEEPVSEEDETTGRSDRIPTFHGYSASGNATGELVYANSGRRQDYDKLVEEGIDLEGKIVSVRYGGIFRGLKVKFAEELGAAAVSIYSDPAEDGSVTEKNGLKAYPDGPARNPDSVQRGSVQDSSHAPGDPTTPGFASTPENEDLRTDPQGIPGIPSIPISYADALPLLHASNGRGPQFPDWKGGLDGVRYSVGPSKQQVVVENSQDYAFRPNKDVIARFPGKSSQEVIIGNHRDSWIIGGADPNSGSAVSSEVAHVLGELIEAGWQPERTIVLASWDGEEYGSSGSTEWGEDHADNLKKNAVAYLNCDVAYSGTQFHVSANPLSKFVIDKSANNIEFKNTTSSNYWGGNVHNRISKLGSGSDYTVFQDHLGIPSFDVGFSGGDKAVYHYHSNYDSSHWMLTYGDADMEYHEAITRFISLSASQLVDGETIPFGVVDYARALKHDVHQLLNSYEGPASEKVNELYIELQRLRHQAKSFSNKLREINHDWQHLKNQKGFWNGLKKKLLRATMMRLNKKLQKLDQNSLYAEGLEDRPWFKHLAYAPGRYTGYAGQVSPGIAESLEDKDDVRLEKWVEITTASIKALADDLE